MKNILKSLIFGIILMISHTSTAQQNNYELETNYMNCMYSLYEDNGAALKVLIKKAEQSLITAEVLEDASGKSYMALYKNIMMAVDGRMSNFGVSDHVIKALSGTENIKKYSTCMNGILTNKTFENSKLSKFISLSTSGNSDSKITTLTSKMLEIFEAKDFEHDFYKYLTFSLIDKFNAANKK